MKTIIMSLVFSCAVSAAVLRAATADERPVQTVIISFDGAHDTAQWQRSLDLGRRTGAQFTYFLSCVFALSPEHKQFYNAPDKGTGQSNVGFGKSRADVAERLNYIWQANLEGHEMASHACGHFDGKDWTKAQWVHEFDQFDRILKNAWVVNGDEREPDGWRAMIDSINGFRAPYLSASANLYAALGNAKFAYDASKVERDIHAPKTEGALVQFALPTIAEGPQQRRVIAMDYNLFVRHSGGFERGDANGAFEQRTLDALNAAFTIQYEGARHPVQFGLHFTLMNDGAYWRAIERFAADVCTKADVRCVSYRTYLAQPPTRKLVAAKPGAM
jgi:peptidoglycan/xylan/chitin deacetylase (PgdA/CDA1 family)